MPQINLKLNGVPIKIPNGYFFPQETWKMYTEKQRAKDFFFSRNLSRKFIWKIQQPRIGKIQNICPTGIKAVIKLKQLRNMALSQTQGNWPMKQKIHIGKYIIRINNENHGQRRLII